MDRVKCVCDLVDLRGLVRGLLQDGLHDLQDLLRQSLALGGLTALLLCQQRLGGSHDWYLHKFHPWGIINTRHATLLCS